MIKSKYTSLWDSCSLFVFRLLRSDFWNFFVLFTKPKYTRPYNYIQVFAESAISCKRWRFLRIPVCNCYGLVLFCLRFSTQSSDWSIDPASRPLHCISRIKFWLVLSAEMRAHGLATLSCELSKSKSLSLSLTYSKLSYTQCQSMK